MVWKFNTQTENGLRSTISPTLFCRGQKFLAGIATGDNTWVPHHTPATKCATMEWETSWVPRNKKFKILKSYDEMIFTMFWEYKGVFCSHTSSRKVQQPVQLHMFQQWTIYKWPLNVTTTVQHKLHIQKPSATCLGFLCKPSSGCSVT